MRQHVVTVGLGWVTLEAAALAMEGSRTEAVYVYRDFEKFYLLPVPALLFNFYPFQVR